MHIKALENGDSAAAHKIRYTKDPREIKRIGSNLTVKKDEKWNTIRLWQAIGVIIAFLAR